MLAANGLSVVKERQERFGRGESFDPGENIGSKCCGIWHGHGGSAMAIECLPLCVFDCDDLKHQHGPVLTWDMAGVSPESRNTMTARSAEQSRAARTITLYLINNRPGESTDCGHARALQSLVIDPNKPH